MKYSRNLAIVSLIVSGSLCAIPEILPLGAEATPVSPAPASGVNAVATKAANADVQAIVAANSAFEEAWGRPDGRALDRLLDPRFTWIDPSGTLLSREEALANWPKPVVLSTEAEVTQRTYGPMAILQIRRGNAFVLRLWTRQSKRWRLLHVIETVQSPRADLAWRPDDEPIGVLSSETGIETECVNPCRVTPFRAHTPNGRAAFASWQQMEIAAAARDMDAWSRHVVEEAIIVDSGGDGAMSKAQRIADPLAQKEEGVRTNEAPPLVWARVFDFGDTVAMLSLQQPYRGQPFYATRVWVHRGSRYQMAVSYHVMVRDVPWFTLSEQLDDP